MSPLAPQFEACNLGAILSTEAPARSTQKKRFFLWGVKKRRFFFVILLARAKKLGMMGLSSWYRRCTQ